MFKFTFVAYPKPSHPRYGEVDGAYATVFVKDPVAASADVAARELVDEALWDIEELDDWAPGLNLASSGGIPHGSVTGSAYSQSLEVGA